MAGENPVTIHTVCKCIGVVFALSLFNAMYTSAAEDSGFRHALFDGESLNGWTIENDCVVDVVDGCIRLKSGTGWLRHDNRLRDFRLHIEWKALGDGQYDSGIFFRASSDGKPFPAKGYQVNLLRGREGDVPNIPAASSRGLVKHGDWNVFDLEVKRDVASLAINGKRAWSASGFSQLEGWVGLQVEVPVGGQFLFKNIELTEIGYQSLFNEHDLTGWEPAAGSASECWSVVDRLLVCSGQKGPWLRSAKEYGDFNLRLEYLVAKSGNSGVYIRVPHDGNHHREDISQPEAGIEIQILDDTAPEHAALKDYQYSASIYDLAGAKPNNSRPVGEWNSLDINCRGQQVTTWHNGVRVTRITTENCPPLQLRKTSGFLGLQNHSTVVKFRNLRIGDAIEVEP
jgi:hypothetical protein